MFKLLAIAPIVRCSTRKWRFLAAAVALGAILPVATRSATNEESAATAVPPGRSAGILVPAAITSSDRFFQISAVPASQDFRLPVLTFCDTFRKNFLRETRLELPVPAQSLTIFLGDATNDVRVLRARVTDLAGRPRERIEIPDPEHAGLDALRFALTQALVADWQQTVESQEGRQAPVVPPDWFLSGLARHIGNTTRGADFDLVYAQWTRGRVPPVAELLAAEPGAAMRHPALPAVIAAWMLEHPGRPIADLLRSLAIGNAWSAEQTARSMRGDDDRAALSEAWDAWLTAGARAVRELGVTPPTVVNLFRAQLLLYPGDAGVAVSDSWRGRTLAECLEGPSSESLRTAARNQAMRIRMFAAGRDGAMRRVADAYAAVLDGMVAGVAPEKLRVLLSHAEEMRAELERRAAAGEVLREALPDARPPERRGR